MSEPETKIPFFIPEKLATWLNEAHEHPWLKENLREAPRTTRGRGHSVHLTLTPYRTRALRAILQGDASEMEDGGITTREVGMRHEAVLRIIDRIDRALRKAQA